MALPKWITPAGNLGIIPELDYYQFNLDAVDPSGGDLVFTRVSGRLPLGIQVVPTGRLQGIPVSELTGDLNVTYKFTIRVTNSETGEVADRTFELTVSNVAPPVIVPKNRYLGVILDGAFLNEQLIAVEATPGAELQWSLIQGELPGNVTLSSSGLLSGYIEPIPEIGPGSLPGWDRTSWNLLGWDFPLRAIRKTFNFTIEVTDGVNYDVSSYRIDVFPRGSITADNNDLYVDTTYITVDLDSAKHFPIILTTQEDFYDVRQDSYYSFQIEARDIDNDVLEYFVASLSSGAFDEQTISGNSLPYVTAVPASGNISAGVYPYGAVNLIDVDDNPTTSETIIDRSIPNYINGDTIKVLTSGLWREAVVNNHSRLKLVSDVLVTGPVGGWLTQAISGANAKITSVSSTTGTLEFSGPITANIGDYIVQPSTGANATIQSTVTSVAIIPVVFNSNNFSTVSGNITINGVWANANVRPTDVNCETQVGIYYQNANVFTIGVSTSAAFVQINGANSFSYPSAVTSVGVTLGSLATEGTVGFDEGKFDQGTLALPVGLSMDLNSGWITGNIPASALNEVSYEFEVEVYKRDFPEYSESRLYTLTVLGDLNNKVNWLTGTNLGTIENGEVSDLAVVAESTRGYDLRYTFTPGSAHRLPQGLKLLPSGLIAGRVSFEMFNLDRGVMTLDGGATVFDTVYNFSVRAVDWNTINVTATNITQLEVQGVISANVGQYITQQVSGANAIVTANVVDGPVVSVSIISGEFITVSQGSSSGNIRVNGTLVNTYPIDIISEITCSNTAGMIGATPITFNGNLGGIEAGKTYYVKDIISSTGFTISNNPFGIRVKLSEATGNITAEFSPGTLSSDKAFTLKVVKRNEGPYEDLYLRALLSIEQKTAFNNIMDNSSVFPEELIYRKDDPNFGVASTIKTLFLPGLDASLLAEYVDAMQTNHYNKSLRFGNIKTAVARDENFNVKYEVVYIEILDENTSVDGQAPANRTNLAGIISNPYYDANGQSYFIIYPNAFDNMSSVIANEIGYENKGALPDWMTSRQNNGRVLGFTRAAVLAYTVPGESAKIAYRLQQSGFNFNQLDFTVDRYQLDNIYSENYDIVNQRFITSQEVTFDRYPRLAAQFTASGTVNYAVSISFEEINQHNIEEIRALGGFDGIKTFNDGDTVVFAQQEFFRGQGDLGDYNQGWNNVEIIWDTSPWAFNADTTDSDYSDPPPPTNFDNTDATPGEQWNRSAYVPGYNENLLDPNVPNQRIGIWRININSNNIVSLTFVGEINYYDKLYVRSGFTYGGTNIYYDPIVKQGFQVPNYSIIPEQIRTDYTTFDGNGTRFFDYRDEYVLPESGDKYIKFPKLGVFT